MRCASWAGVISPHEGELGHGLVVEQAEGQAVQTGGLHPTVLEVELDQRDPLDQLPRDRLRQHRARLGLVLAHDEPHLGRLASPPRPAESLQE
jgi:hypothetical protein